MNPLQLSCEGYKARGESCKQGGTVATVLLGILGFTGKAGAVGSLGFFAALAVGLSALAYLFLGRAITQAAEASPGPAELSLREVVSRVGWQLAAANVVGVLEIILLVVGLGLTVVALG